MKAEWGGKANFASFTSQARGVAIFFTKNLALDIIEESIFADKSGNFIVLNVKYENHIITLACIYGPNNDDPNYYANVVFPETELCQQTSDFTVMGGDWNVTLSQDLDTFGYNTENNVNAKNQILSSVENLGLVDVFRTLNPDIKRFSWRQFGGNKRARLDFFLISATLLPFIDKADIFPGLQSDHSMPVLDIDFTRFHRGRGFFKFNSSLLSDPEYVKLIIEAIRNVAVQYAEDIYDQNYLKNATPEQLQLLVYTLDPQLLLEVLLLEIRGKTIAFCSWKKKTRNAAHMRALRKLELAEMNSDWEPDNEQLRKQMDEARQEVAEYTSKAAEGAECRSRVQWHVEGEKPSKFFCHLEKYNALQKYIPNLITKDEAGHDKFHTNQKDIENETFKFYQDLYKSQESMLNYQTIDEFLGPNEQLVHCHCQDLLGSERQLILCHCQPTRPKLSREEAERLEGKISIEEATKYMKQCRLDASPGSSGFTGGFYKFFWRNLKHFIVNSLNYAYETGNLSITQKLGVIILLPKPEKDKRYLTNWRPISLLNHVYKILSGVLTERLKPTLESIIHVDQKGFVAGRYIGECIRNTYDVLEYAKSKNRAGMLLLIDFEKAFDSISHSFIIKCLYFFGFGFSFIKWINVILNDVSSCINHCGNISDRFRIERSCRQGDPISPYLFIICVEILAMKIREEGSVKGFKVGKFEQKLDFYADDLTAYLDGSEGSLVSILNILDKFRQISGLKINLSKCKAVWIGKYRNNDFQLCKDLKLIWTNKFKLLGVDFDSDLATMDNNFYVKLDEIEKLYKCWLYRHLTPFGKITIIKSMALSKLSHVAMVCPNMDPEILQRLNNMSFKFLWNNKPDRLKRSTSILPLELGGLNMPDIGAFWLSLKLSWTRRFMAKNCLWQKILSLNLLYQNHDMFDVWYGGPSLISSIAEKMTNLFWREILTAIAIFSNNVHFAHPYFFYNLNIFDNPLFSINNIELKSSDFLNLWNKKVCQVGDFFKRGETHPVILTLREFNEKYNFNVNFLNYHRIKAIIINAAQKLNNKIFDNNASDIQAPKLPLIHKLSCMQAKGCRVFYTVLKSRDWTGASSVDCENKWQTELGTNFSVDFWNRIWKINKYSIVSNKLKWINLQITRFILPTNYTVNKYNPNQDPRCSYCNLHLERLPDLIWSCPVVRGFWSIVGTILTTYFPEFNLGRKEAIFGDVKSKGNSVINTMILLAKKFILKEKFGSKTINRLRYISFIRQELRFIIQTMEFRGKKVEFLKEWNEILQHFEVI